MVGICEDSTDILDTFFDDVVVGVVVDGLGCEPQSNPLLCKPAFTKQNLCKV